MRAFVILGLLGLLCISKTKAQSFDQETILDRSVKRSEELKKLDKKGLISKQDAIEYMRLSKVFVQRLESFLKNPDHPGYLIARNSYEDTLEKYYEIKLNANWRLLSLAEKYNLLPQKSIKSLYRAFAKIQDSIQRDHDEVYLEELKSQLKNSFNGFEKVFRKAMARHKNKKEFSELI